MTAQPSPKATLEELVAFYLDNEGKIKTSGGQTPDYSRKGLEDHGPCSICGSATAAPDAKSPANNPRADARWRRDSFHYHVGLELFICQVCYQKRHRHFNLLQAAGKLDKTP